VVSIACAKEPADRAAGVPRDAACAVVRPPCSGPLLLLLLLLLLLAAALTSLHVCGV